jgi:Family of unknown function (DUF6623)
MALHASWNHGNAVRVETPENFKSIKPMGWGTDLELIPGRQSWLHIPVPTPVIVDDVRVRVRTLFLLFNSDLAFLHDVHIFDGPSRIQSFDLLGTVWGQHGSAIDTVNTFKLSTSHSVSWAMSISFRFEAAKVIEVPRRPTLSVVAAGADFSA